MNSRSLLLRHLQAFFEEHLRGRYRWATVGEDGESAPRNTIRVRPAEKHEKLPGKRQLEKAVAAIDFDGYALVVSSPEEKPPLGEILLFHPEHGEVRGALDSNTWTMIAHEIKFNQNKDVDRGPR